MKQDEPSLFALPELLPNNARLLVDANTSTAFLLRFEGPEFTFSSRSFQLTPSATRVFLALLHAYPLFCSYHSLFLALYPLSQEHETNRTWDCALALRPIRRALITLLPTLRDLGLQVVALRGQGYILAAHMSSTHA